MSTTAVTPNPSAPAAESTLKIPARGSAEYDHWRKTGEVTLPGPNTADPDPAQLEDTNDLPDIPSGDAKPASEAAAAPEAAPSQDTQRRKRGDAGRRIQELLEENRKLRLENQQRDGKPNSSPATEPEKKQPEKAARPTPKDLDPKTNQPKYKDWAEYEDALLAWNTEQVLSKVDERLSAKDREAKVKSDNDALVKDFQGQIDAAKKEYSDFEEVAFNNPAIKGQIPRGSIIDLCIMQTPLGAKTLYYLGKNPGKIAEILKLPAFQQSAELVKIQQSLEKTATPVIPAKTKSNAPPPPTELGTRAMVPGDEVQAAVKSDSARGYIEAANARDLARRRGKG